MSRTLDPAQTGTDQTGTDPKATMTTTTTQIEHGTAAIRADRRTRTTLTVLFALYLVLLVWTVLWKLDVPWTGGARRTVKLVPFVAAGGHGASEPFEVAMNLLLFVPFGLYLGLLTPARRWWRHVGVVAGASLGLEVVQFVLAVGSSDVTDLLANTAGGAAGLGLLALVSRRLRGRTTLVVTRACAVATVLALLAGAAFIASPVRFGGPPPGGGREPGMRLERTTTHPDLDVAP